MAESAAQGTDFHLQFCPLLLLRLLHFSLESLLQRSANPFWGCLKEALTAPKRRGCSPLRISPGMDSEMI